MSVTVMPACDRPVPSLNVNGCRCGHARGGVAGHVGDDRRAGADVVPAGAGRAVDDSGVRVGATVSWLMPLMSAVGVEVLPATSVTVMPACDWLAPSLKVNGAGVVTPEVASLAT